MMKKTFGFCLLLILLYSLAWLTLPKTSASGLNITEDGVLTLCGDEALRGWHDDVNVNDVIHLIISDAKQIPNECFANCAFLRTVTLNEGIVDIGAGAFAMCIRLIQIELPQSLQTIGEEAFFMCESLKTLRMPKDAKFNCYEDDSGMFDGSGLETLIVEGDIELGGEAFHRPGLLKRIVYLNEPPSEIEEGIFDFFCDEFCIYYYESFRLAWSPNGETEWNGCPIFPFESLDELLATFSQQSTVAPPSITSKPTPQSTASPSATPQNSALPSIIPTLAPTKPNPKQPQWLWWGIGAGILCVSGGIVALVLVKRKKRS